MMHPLKSKARLSLPKMRSHKHEKDEANKHAKDEANKHEKDEANKHTKDEANKHAKDEANKHEKDETNEPHETSENHPHNHHHRNHHGHHNNPLLILTKMKYKFNVKGKKDNSSVPAKTLAHSESKLKEVFTRFDVDNDGFVDAWDLGSLVRALGGNPTQAELDKITTREKLYAPFDFNRFAGLVGKYFLDGSVPVQEVQRAFEVLDADSDGYVSVSDLKKLLTTSGEKLDSSEFDQWIQEVEVGPDGKVRYEDVIKTL